VPAHDAVYLIHINARLGCRAVSCGRKTERKEARMRLSVLLIASVCGVAGARAQEAGSDTMTVRSLLRHDFTVVGAIPSPAGPGVFLQKKDQLVLCFVSETKTSKSVTTQYCKSVE
jgi:hypothetical protein